jgi:DNA-binding transcriptional LysR family regulator
MQQHLPAETVVVARVNSWHALREAVSHGLGISHLWCFLADSMTGIQRIHPVSEELNVALWVCHHQDVTSNPRVSAFMQAMESSIRERM